jgi:hypothetical protein
MEYLQAIAIRVRSLNGKAVDPRELEEAIETIQSTRKPVPAGKFAHLVKGSRPRKERAQRKEPQSHAPDLDQPPRKPWELITSPDQVQDPEHYVWPYPED